MITTPSEAAELLDIEEGRDIVTLVTCTPYGVNTHRLLVTGYRVPWPDNPPTVIPSEGQANGLGFWWIPLILAYLSIVLMVGRMIVTNHKVARMVMK